MPANTQVYLHTPEIGIPEKTSKNGRPTSQPRVVNGVMPQRVDQVAQATDTHWQRLLIRRNKRGVLEDDFTARRVWTWKKGDVAPQEE